MVPYICRKEIESYISECPKLGARVQAIIIFLEKEIEQLKIEENTKKNKNEEAKLNSFLFASKKCLWIVNDTQKTLRHFLNDKNVNQKLIYEKIEFVIKTDINFQKLELAIWMHFQR